MCTREDSSSCTRIPGLFLSAPTPYGKCTNSPEELRHYESRLDDGFAHSTTGGTNGYGTRVMALRGGTGKDRLSNKSKKTAS
jgi:hypothetical protein